MAAADKRMLGRWGEQVAAEYLRKKGYRIRGMNYVCRLGELDIIAENRRYLAFVEVKLRKDDRYAAAREYVTASKQRRVILTAEKWLLENPTKKQPRFDVVEVYGENGVVREINHLENAFTL